MIAEQRKTNERNAKIEDNTVGDGENEQKCSHGIVIFIR